MCWLNRDHNCHFVPRIENLSKIIFGDFRKKKNHILARLKGIQNNPILGTNNFLHNLCTQLTSEYNDLLWIEVDPWRMPSVLIG